MLLDASIIHIEYSPTTIIVTGIQIDEIYCIILFSNR